MSAPVQLDILEGLGDDTTSPGCLVIAAEARKISGVTAVVWKWYQWEQVIAARKKLPADRLWAVVGYSNGASEAEQVAAPGITVDLLVALDPTIWLATAPLHGNVKRAICFHNVNWASSFPPVGHASLTTSPDFKGTLQTIDTWDLHINVDTDPVIQATVVAAVRQLAGI
jgi:hypothetical protein